MTACSGPGKYLAAQWPAAEPCCVAHDEAYTQGGDSRLRHIADAEFLL